MPSSLFERDSKPSPWARLRALALFLGAAIALAWFLAAPAAAGPAVGVTADLVALSPEAQAAELTRLVEAGVTSLRLPLDWNRVEPQPQRFTWAADDALVNAALNHGLEVVLVLGPCAEWAVNPAWQVPPEQRRHSVPRSIDLWERYVRASVEHFRGRVRHWQVREQPSARNFRGARSEYLDLLTAAARAARAVDTQSLIVMPEAGVLDVADIDLLAASDRWGDCDVIGLQVPPIAAGFSPPALAWATLTQEVLADADTASPRPLWVLGSEDPIPSDTWVSHYLLASAFGVERCYLPADTVSREWTVPLAGLTYLGFLRLGPPLWALALEGPEGVVVAAWSAEQTSVPASELAPLLDPEALAQASLLGGAPGSALVPDSDPIRLRLGPRPALLSGLEVAADLQARPPTRADILAARPGFDLHAVPLVWVDYSLEDQPEFGLTNRNLRTRPGGAIGEEDRGTRRCLRTRLLPGSGTDGQGDPWIYFDVDDNWLYLARGSARVAITVECEAAFLVGATKLGFNIMYDSSAGYRFTPWQWVSTGAPGLDWRRYRFELEDVSFANRDGYDFRINAQGSRQDLWVAAVTVERLPAPAPEETPDPVS